MSWKTQVCLPELLLFLAALSISTLFLHQSYSSVIDLFFWLSSSHLISTKSSEGAKKSENVVFEETSEETGRESVNLKKIIKSTG